MSPTLQSTLRHLLTALGSAAVARGVFTESQLVEVVGALVALVGAIWGPLDEWIASWKEKHALATATPLLPIAPPFAKEEIELMRALLGQMSARSTTPASPAVEPPPTQP